MATFLLSDECQESIAEAMRQIAEWNPDWKPQQFITDFSEAQMGDLARAETVNGTVPLKVVITKLFPLCSYYGSVRTVAC